MYAQQNFPNKNNITRLTSVSANDFTKKCLVFYYNMFASDSNTLNLYLTQNDISNKVWSIKTNEGNKVILELNKKFLSSDLIISKIQVA